MTYEEARTFIDESSQYGSKLGVETITELLRRLGNPQEKLKVIHVAGTNGKGSTTAFIATILASEGYLVGRYISPAVFSYRERVQISHRVEEEIETDYITELGVSEAVTAIKPICKAMVTEGFSHPTSFEIETAMAILYLANVQVDFAVIEVGLGGRLDATNVIRQPVCCVITSISMDHMQYLGDTLAKITGEKAGIIKAGVPVVTSNTNTEVLKVLADTCSEKGAFLTVSDFHEAENIRLSPEISYFAYQKQEYGITILGEYQIANALLALRTANVLKQLGYPISEESIRFGLRKTIWSGRLEVLAKSPYFLIDGAHNEDAALQLKRAMEQYFPGQQLIFILGVLADKEYHKILRILAPIAKTIYTITPDNNRALASTQLAIEAKKYCRGAVIDAGVASDAVKLAYKEAGTNDVIIAFGSLSYLAEVKAALFVR